MKGPEKAITDAINICGGPSALASALNLESSQVVSNWKTRGRVPAEVCPAIERATNRAVRCEDLRPDVDWAYLRESAGEAA